MKFKFWKLLLLFSMTYTSIFGQKYEIYKNDTINKIDTKNQKQGLWIYFYDAKKEKIRQKGNFVNDQKQGEWTTFYENGKIMSVTTFKNNKPNGYTKSYYPSGNIQEEGNWQLNKWIGEYKYYYENGQLKYHWYYDENGQRTGKQDYFYSNGQKQIEGEWLQGKETGTIKEYHPNGKISKVANFESGKLNGTYSEYYEDGSIKTKVIFIQGEADPQQSYVYSPPVKEEDKKKEDDAFSQVGKDFTKDSTETKQYRIFSGTGYYKFINENGQIDREGTFDKGVLIEGKKYIYDSNGKLVRTAIINNGRVVQIINEK